MGTIKSRRYRVCYCLIACVTFGFILIEPISFKAPLQDIRSIQLYTLPRERNATFIQGESSHVSIHAAETCANEQRQSALDVMCRELSDTNTAFSPDDPNSYNRFVVDDEHQVLYCVVPKAGCTSWKNVLVQQSSKYRSETTHGTHAPGNVHSEQWLARYGIRWLHTFPIHAIKWRLEKYFSFTVVRHPFERLYSAYKDKIQSQWNKTFESFLESMSLDIDSRLSEATEASLLSDRHFKQQYGLCHPCSISYDYIAKLETIWEDSKVLLPKLNATELPAFNVKADTNDVHGRATEVELENKAHWVNVINGVPEHQFQVLRNFYALDFEAFEYEWDKSTGPVCNSLRDDGSSCC